MTQETKKNSVLIIDDEKENLSALTNILKDEYIVYTAENGKEAIKISNEKLPDVILLDMLISDMEAQELMSSLKNSEERINTPVLFVTGLGEPENEEKGLSTGAADYIIKPFNPATVKLRVRNQIQIIKQIEMIKKLSTMDQLTEVSNRRNFDLRINVEWEHAKREKKPLSLILFDIDNFKKYNDTYGHLQGDTALQAVAKITELSLRRSLDLLARWGGEEFVVLLPDTDSHGAMVLAENIRKNIEDTEIPCTDGSITKITVSIGVITYTPGQDCEIKKFFNGADIALYQAKHTGKNKVCKFDLAKAES